MSTVGKIRRYADLNIFTSTGTVVGQQGHTSTHVQSETTTHGTNYLGGPSGSTRTTTTSTHHQRLFARKDNGGEFDVEFPDLQFGVREGHRIAAVFAGHKSTGRGHPMALINHTTGHFQTFPAHVNWILSNHTKTFAMVWGCLLAMLLVTTRGDLSGLTLPVLFVGGAVVAWEVFRWLTLYRRVRLEVDKVAQAVFQQGAATTGA